MVTGILVVCAILFVLFVVWCYVTNPFNALNITHDFFRLVVEPGHGNNLPSQVTISQKAEARVLQSGFARRLALLKAGAHIASNVYIGSKKAKRQDYTRIAEQIHALRFRRDLPFLISGDHFSILYPRSLGIFYHTLMDSRTALSRDDWLDRQIIYLKTLAYALEVFSKSGTLSTTIVPLGRKTVGLMNIYAFPADTLYSLLYALKVTTDDSEITSTYSYASKRHYPLATKAAARKLFESYKDFLRQQLEQFTATYVDPSTHILRADITLSGTKDIAKQYSGFYANVLYWKSLSLAQDLGLVPVNRQQLSLLKQSIVQAFWLPDEGYFLEDLSTEAIEKRYYSSDWLVAVMSGFLRPDDTEDRAYLVRLVDYIWQEKLAVPFGIKFQQTDRKWREHAIVKLLAPDYGGTAIWSHWGMEYIKLLTMLYRHTRDEQYITEAQRNIRIYQHTMVNNHGYPELYHEDGRMYSRFLYKSVRQTGWVVNFEQAEAMCSFYSRAE